MAQPQPLQLDHAKHTYLSVVSDQPLTDVSPLKVVGPIGDGLLASSYVVQIGDGKASNEDIDAAKRQLAAQGARDITLLEAKLRSKRTLPGEL